VGEDKVCEDPPKIEAPQSQNIEYICNSLHLCIYALLCRSFDRPAYGFHHMNLALLESNASLLLCKVYSLYLLINERTMKISSLSQRTLHVQSPLQINVEIHHLLLIHNCGCHWTSKSRWLKQLQHTLSQSLLKSTTLYPICLMFVIGSVVLRPRSLFQFSFMQFFI
jgi:hypothetical protein